MKKIVIIIITIVILGVLIIAWGLIKKPAEAECNEDSDCTFFWTNYSVDNPCGSCDLADENWICMNVEDAEIERGRLMEEGKIASCSPCPPEAGPQVYFCECSNSKCEKVKRE